MLLSIIIVNWNTKELITTCIDSIFNTTPINEIEYEIIVIDNNSNDGSLEYLKKLQDKIKLISNSQNLGYAAACNQGMKIASGKYILLLGSDTLMHKDTLKFCINFLENNEDSGAVCCKLLNPDGTVQNSLKKFPKLKNAFFTYLSLDKFNKDYDMADFEYNTTIQVEQAAATFIMARNEVLKKIGYFDTSYRILYNDVDLCYKIIKLNYKIFFLHNVSVTHYGSQSTKKAKFKLRKTMYGDIYRYYSKYYGFKAKFLYPILVFRLLIVSTIKL
jgi:GT2 family glycosyltransferase